MLLLWAAAMVYLDEGFITGPPERVWWPWWDDDDIILLS